MKKRMYAIFCILTAVFVLSTAAVCSLCSSLGEKVSAEGLLEKISSQSGDNNGDAEEVLQNDDGNNDSGNNDSPNGSSSDKDGSSGGSQNENGNQPGDNPDNSGSQGQGNDNKNNNGSNKSAKSGNNPPVINSISASSDTFLPGNTYTFTSDVTDPDNDTIYYNWHIDAGSMDNWESPIVNWTLPNEDGLYIITLTVNDGWGGSDSMSREIFVGKASSGSSPVIDSILISPSGGIYTDNTYEIWCSITDSVGIADVSFSINGGVLHSQNANYIKWDTPGAPGTYKLNVTVTDKAGNKTSGSKDFVVEQSRVEISDIIVQIDYIEAGISYNIKAVVVDPKGEITGYEWSCSGGNIYKPLGHLAGWKTPDNPGTYSLTLKAFTAGGGTVSRTEEFEVKPPK